MNDRLDKDGNEILDNTPVAIPAGYRKPPTLQEQIRMLLRHERYQQAVESGEIESIEEADDFETGDPDDNDSFSTPYEMQADMVDLRRMIRDEKESIEYEAKVRSKIKKPQKQTPKTDNKSESVEE